MVDLHINTVKATSTMALLPFGPCPNPGYYAILSFSTNQVKCCKLGFDDQAIARDHLWYSTEEMIQGNEMIAVTISLIGRAMKFAVHVLISIQIQHQGHQYNLDWNMTSFKIKMSL